MGFIGVEWDHPWIYWWFFPAIPPFGDTAWAGSLGLIPSTFEVAVTRATSSHSLTILTISKDGWSTLKYFEVLWSIDYWLLISYLQGHPRPLCPVDSMKQHETNHTHHTLHTPRAGQHGRHEVQSDFHKWLWMLWRVPKMAGNVPKYP